MSRKMNFHPRNAAMLDKNFLITRAPSVPWLRVKAAAQNDPAEIWITGQIGANWWDDSGTSEKQFRDELKKIPKGRAITVHINSEGGSIKDGLGMYNALKERRADVTCVVDGYAVSIASVIALAGGKTVSPKSSIWMIHEPWSMTQGNAEDHLRSAEMLDTHGDMLAAIYADEIGKSKTVMRDAMRKETWFSGEEATEYGLADETPADDQAPALAALDVSRFKNIPAHVMNMLPKRNPINDDTIPGKISPSKTDGSQAGAAASEPTQLKNNMPDNTTAAATPPAKDNSAEIIDLRAQLAAERKERITAKVTARAEGKIPNDGLQFYIDAAIADEAKTLAAIDKLPVVKAGADPVGGSVVQVSAENPLEGIKKKFTDAKARFVELRDNWRALYDDALARDSRRGLAQGSNTYSATLVTSILIDGAVTNLQNRWAMLKAFSLDISTDTFKPKATAVIRNVTAGGTTQTNATNFESGDSTVAAVSATISQITQSFNVSNADLQSGLRMENLVVINTANFANAVIELANAQILSSAYTVGLTQPAGAFNFSDLATLQALLKKSPIKNLILDGTYIARIANTPGFFQTAGVLDGSTGAWKAFGWDVIAQNTDWTGATANTQGFACNPQALAGVTGLPVSPPVVPGGILQEGRMTVPGLEIPIATYQWFNPATRTHWQSFDIMAGFKPVDTTAGFIIASA